MTFKAISFLAENLNEYLKLCFRLTENIAFISPPSDTENVYPSNRISISLVNLEKETNGGIAFTYQQVSGEKSRKSAPAWQLNLYVLIAAIFTEKQYKDSIQMLSGVLSFIQKNHLFTVEGISIAMESVNLSIQELSNLWSICGGKYYPSVLCKIRVISINEQEIIDLSTVVSQQNLEPDIKKN